MSLPPDLIALGFKLIVRAPDRMFAVSQRRGCTGIKPTLDAVVSEARNIAGFIEWVERKQEVKS